ncbi:helix-turn-helix domain-containing protein [Aquabacterium sp. A7-Y]|uniref:helix-turn-helix domain-containing protein n=1 Tax=Aquabacterium sp. A7-Y TaxID=1349605 RepID=UPI00223D8B63|nr:helix-turn-helix domain-containing protein [Aquabacterium sp. A7-Y]MCW7538348.1 helix-turn-helix domain-containing protein [Aquabacterium sp. A7-Y]
MSPTLHQQHTCDVDEQAALLRGWNQRYAQLSRGVFEGEIREAWLPAADGSVHLFVERTSRQLLQVGALSPGRLALGVPLALPAAATFCAASTRDGDSLFVFSGASGFEFGAPAGLVMAGIELDAGLLGAGSRVPEQAGLRPAPAARCSAWRAFVTHAFEALAAAPAGLAVRHAAALRSAAVQAVAELLTDDAAPHEPDLTAQRRWKLVARARDIVLSRPDEPPSVQGLCLQLGISRRSLQLSFQDVLGTSPAHFLRAVRLAGVRRLLRSADSVTEAALHWGFWHLGHFSQEYRELFGETPSATWRRHHGTAAPGRER